MTTASGGYATTDLTANWVQNARAYSGTVLTSQLGTGMSESSGVFTFPSTGHWLVRFQALFVNNGTTMNEGATWIYASNNCGSNWTLMTATGTSIKDEAGSEYKAAAGQMYLDVTNASTFRVKFAIRSSEEVLVVTGGAAASEIRTYAQFVKQADT